MCMQMVEFSCTSPWRQYVHCSRVLRSSYICMGTMLLGCCLLTWDPSKCPSCFDGQIRSTPAVWEIARVASWGTQSHALPELAMCKTCQTARVLLICLSQELHRTIGPHTCCRRASLPIQLLSGCRSQLGLPHKDSFAWKAHGHTTCELLPLQPADMATHPLAGCRSSPRAGTPTWGARTLTTG